MTTIWRKSASIIPAYGHMVCGGFEVEIGVWPVALDHRILNHRIGVVWTADGWHNVQWSDAEWIGTTRNNYGDYDEVWKAKIDYNSNTPLSFWYALYVIDTYGNWYWDNNNGWNYITQGPNW